MTNTLLHITQIQPTLFLVNTTGTLQQLVHVHVHNTSEPTSTSLVWQCGSISRESALGVVPAGDSIHDFYVNDVLEPAAFTFILKSHAGNADPYTVDWMPPRHWVVHVVQASHHDLGYTDLASNVLHVHDQWLNDTIDLADQTQMSPYDARFRIVIEQGWSLHHFLKSAPPERSSRILGLLREGQFELTAFYGNMTTELCNPEEMIRCLYPAFRLKREHGVPLTSAEHNDITGISWGLCQALTDAGVQIFVPGMPLYYAWGGLHLDSFWDEEAIFGRGGPGAFWWQAPSGRKLLLWCNNSGCGGDYHPNLPGMLEALQRAQERDYPWQVMRWPVNGGARDNAPYIPGFAEYIREWNERWAYPHLISSTNAMFLADLKDAMSLPGAPTLPVWCGEIPGQDYPVGATSTAAATATNRAAHASLITAEKLAALANVSTDDTFPSEQIQEAYEEQIIFDEHSWGHHFPAGPTALASQMEKAVHAYRSAALAHDVLNKAMASVADRVAVSGGGIPLVIFNMTGSQRTGVVRAPMRELDNCGSTMMHVLPEDDTQHTGYMRGVLLHNRWHRNLPSEVLAGHFRLRDAVSGEEVAYQRIQLQPDSTVPHAPERSGIGAGSRRYAIFEQPVGLQYDLCFTARDVPAHGYKTYLIEPIEPKPNAVSKPVRTTLRSSTTKLENDFYRITFDRKFGVTSILDKETGCEILDPQSEHPFGALVVRDPSGATWTADRVRVSKGYQGPLCASVNLDSTVHGHPVIHQTITLYHELKRIEFATRILKDPTPLLDAHLAFPFALANPRFRYEGVLAMMTPGVDVLPGAQSDRLAVQNWVKVTDGKFSILWSPMDAPVASLGNLWQGYVSQAHRCLVTADMSGHQRVTPDQMTRAWIYSDICYNNLGTNFAVSQSGELLFRYVISTANRDVTDTEAAEFGWQAISPFEQILAKSRPDAHLGPSGSLIDITGKSVVLLALKQAEDGHGMIARLWNTQSEDTTTQLSFHQRKMISANLTNAVEEDQGPLTLASEHAVVVTVGARDITTVRLILS